MFYKYIYFQNQTKLEPIQLVYLNKSATQYIVLYAKLEPIQLVYLNLLLDACKSLIEPTWTDTVGVFKFKTLSLIISMIKLEPIQLVYLNSF